MDYLSRDAPIVLRMYSLILKDANSVTSTNFIFMIFIGLSDNLTNGYSLESITASFICLFLQVELNKYRRNKTKWAQNRKPRKF
jgi:hypothetical protein